LNYFYSWIWQLGIDTWFNFRVEIVILRHLSRVRVRHVYLCRLWCGCKLISWIPGFPTSSSLTKLVIMTAEAFSSYYYQEFWVFEFWILNDELSKRFYNVNRNVFVGAMCKWARWGVLPISNLYNILICINIKAWWRIQYTHSTYNILAFLQHSVLLVSDWVSVSDILYNPILSTWDKR